MGLCKIKDNSGKSKSRRRWNGKKSRKYTNVCCGRLRLKCLSRTNGFCMYKVERILYDGSGWAHRRVLAVVAAKTIKTRRPLCTVFVNDVGGSSNTYLGDVLSAKNTRDTSGDMGTRRWWRAKSKNNEDVRIVYDN